MLGKLLCTENPSHTHPANTNVCQLLKGKFDHFRQLFAPIFERQCCFTPDDCGRKEKLKENMQIQDEIWKPSVQPPPLSVLAAAPSNMLHCTPPFVRNILNKRHVPPTFFFSSNIIYLAVCLRSLQTHLAAETENKQDKNNQKTKNICPPGSSETVISTDEDQLVMSEQNNVSGSGSDLTLAV